MLPDSIHRHGGELGDLRAVHVRRNVNGVIERVVPVVGHPAVRARCRTGTTCTCRSALVLSP